MSDADKNPNATMSGFDALATTLFLVRNGFPLEFASDIAIAAMNGDPASIAIIKMTKTHGPPGMTLAQ